MGDAADYEEWKEEQAELDYLQHLKSDCFYGCPYCKEKIEETK